MSVAVPIDDQAPTLLDEIRRCQPWIEAALEHAGGTHIFTDVAGLILDGRAQLWSVDDGCIVTEFVDFPRQRHLNLWLAGGEMKACLSLLPEIEGFANRTECARLTMAGRHGWGRVLAREGWTQPLTVMTKEVRNG